MALTDSFILTIDWSNVSNGAGAVQISNSDGRHIEWCVATSDSDADLCDAGHRVYAPLLWEGSAEGQDLYMRGRVEDIEKAESQDGIDFPQIVVTLYP